MVSLSRRTRIVVAVALLAPAMASLSRIAMPGIASASTYALGSTLFLTFASIVLIGYRKGQASTPAALPPGEPLGSAAVRTSVGRAQTASGD